MSRELSFVILCKKKFSGISVDHGIVYVVVKLSFEIIKIKERLM